MPANMMGTINCEMPPRLRTSPAEATVPIAGGTTTSTRGGRTLEWCRVCKGLLPVTLYSLVFLAFPLLDFYADIDYDDTTVRVLVIASSFLAATLVLLANDCVAWFNMALFFHVGVEATVLDKLATYAQASTTDTTGTALAWVAAAVILVHLVPFFLVDHAGVMTLLAFAGTIVNTSALVFVEPGMLLLVGFSSVILLGLVLLIASIECVRTSMLSQLRQAVKEGTWLLCTKYEI